MSLVSFFKSNGENGFGYSSTAEEVTEGIDLTGKNILITGCNSGLGKESARVLALRGATIFGTARTKEKAESTATELKIERFHGFACELSDPRSVRNCVEEVKATGHKIDVLMCNAGIMALPNLEESHGFELQFFTNHIGHFILVIGLLGSLSENGRVVMLSSSAHKMAPNGGIEFDNLDGKKGYQPWKAYGQSKIANLLFAKELAIRFKGTGKTAYAVHPGVIQTNLSRHMASISNTIFSLAGPVFLKSIEEGAATQCYVATSPNIENLSGSYFADCNVSGTRREANDKNLSKKLFDVSLEIIEKLK
ncbi:MAG: SDR family oxidoreductase [Leptospiraceae bacterium]|nr:SDR family oxidoreductase [Leptospiraceae bacterium]MCP5513094.1 SDR family oxidoreductase [Leptospiraceae bacterium]